MNEIERINLRLNLEDPIDSVIWDYVKDAKKKGTFVKMVLYNAALGLEKSIEPLNNKNIITAEEVEEVEGF